jgi:hypothetical protein
VLETGELLTGHGGIKPTYVRRVGGKVRVAEQPHELMEPGEIVRIWGQVIVGRLMGAHKQIYSPFVDIEKLEDSSVYRVTDSDVTLTGSAFSFDKHASYDAIRAYWLAQFRSYAADDAPFAIPLSGGYDSRLNLASALDVASKDRVTAYHEFKDETEASIARRVAEAFGVSLTIVQRDDHTQASRALSGKTDFVLRSGLNRENIRRWSFHLSKMRDTLGPNTAIVGLGAEPHKGKHYNQIARIEEAGTVFTIDAKREASVAELLGLNPRAYRNLHADYVAELIERSRTIYDDTASQIDFVHYHAFVVGSYGNRSRFFSELHNVAFPQFGREFLNLVFSLPRDQKEGFAIVKRLLSELGGPAKDIPYLSGNAGSVGKRPGFTTKLKNKWREFTTPPKPPRYDISLTDRRPQSTITAAILRAIENPSPVVSRTDAICVYNYLTLLEAKYGVTFQAV